MKEKSNSTDLITFWESFEHIPYPIKTIEKSRNYLKSNGKVVIECPNYNSWEKLLFGPKWFHLDPPRHLFHYTKKGLLNLLEKNGFKKDFQKSIFTPEYIAVGLTQSILYSISPKLNIFAFHNKSFSYYILLTIIIILTIFLFPVSYFFYLLKGSPIQLLVCKKN